MNWIGQVHTHNIKPLGGSTFFSEQDMQLASGQRFNGWIPNPTMPKPVYISTRVPNDGNIIEVRKYTANSGLSAWGIKLWP